MQPMDALDDRMNQLVFLTVQPIDERVVHLGEFVFLVMEKRVERSSEYVNGFADNATNRPSRSII